jgi:hypothetical protein
MTIDRKIVLSAIAGLLIGYAMPHYHTCAAYQFFMIDNSAYAGDTTTGTIWMWAKDDNSGEIHWKKAIGGIR